jgi:hypothetical protein
VRNKYYTTHVSNNSSLPKERENDIKSKYHQTEVHVIPSTNSITCTVPQVNCSVYERNSSKVEDIPELLIEAAFLFLLCQLLSWFLSWFVMVLMYLSIIPFSIWWCLLFLIFFIISSAHSIFSSSSMDITVLSQLKIVYFLLRKMTIFILYYKQRMY